MQRQHRRPSFLARRPYLEPLEDRCLLSIDLVSAGVSGSAGNGSSEYPSITADGRYVTFESHSSDLVAGDTNAYADIFVRDFVTGTTRRVSTDGSGREANYPSAQASINADGRYVAFQSDANNLVSGDTGYVDVFVKDLVAGTTTRVSTDSLGGQANNDSIRSCISTNGRYVAFSSGANNLVTDDTNGAYDVFVKDILTGTTALVSTDSLGTHGNGGSGAPSLSNDGRYVAFASFASNLVPGDTNGDGDVFVRDLWTGGTTRVSLDTAGGQGNGESSTPNMSADGRYVAFDSAATNLVPGDTNGESDVFLKDLWTGTTARVSTDSSSNQAVGGSFAASLSGDSRYVAFASWAGNLAPTPTNGYTNVFIKDVTTGTIACVSLTSSEHQGNGNSDKPIISDDGRYVTFESAANLVPADGNIFDDIYRVWNPFFAPEIRLSSFSIAENQPIGTTVGTFSMTGAEQRQSFTYALVPGQGDSDNAAFTIEGNTLKAAATFDFETRSTYSIRVRSTDGASVTSKQSFTITITDLHDFASAGLYNPATSTFYLRSANTTGNADYTFGYGEPNAGWQPLVGDWNGDHSDGVGLFAPQSSTFYLTNAFTSGYAQYAFGYGEPNAGWKPLVGDWNGNGASGVGLYAPSSSTFYLTDTLTTGYAEYTVGFGQPGANWQPLVGCWTTAGSQGQTTAPTAQAVDQLDLASLAAKELSPASALNDLDIGLP